MLSDLPTLHAPEARAAMVEYVPAITRFEKCHHPRRQRNVVKCIGLEPFTLEVVYQDTDTVDTIDADWEYTLIARKHRDGRITIRSV